MNEERRIVVVDDQSDQRRVVVEQGERSIVVRGDNQRISVSVAGGIAVGGGNAIGNYPVSISNLATDDVIAYDGTSFINRRQTLLTDGGNF